MLQKSTILITAMFLLVVLSACSAESAVGVSSEAGETAIVDSSTAVADVAVDATAEPVAVEDEEVARPEGWTTETHSKDADLNYDVVFPDDVVNTITITIAPDQWEAMQANMTEILGEAGTGEGGEMGGFGQRPGNGDFMPPGGMEPPADFTPPAEGMEPPADFTPPAGGMEPPTDGFQPGERPAGGGMGGAVDMVSETPMWVEATVEFNGITWNHVGVRYKGNSSLTSAWNSGSLKMPLKLDFDEFEDTYPEVDNQRFYGFKQISLANGFSDDTYLRETVTYDLMRQSGLIASNTAFYEIILDYGEGPVSLGIYTAVEVVDDTVIENALGDDDGNIYEGDGSGVSLAEGTYDQIADSFEKENNEDAADWSDIEALYNALHAETRTTDPEQWRADLEAVFDVDTFLNWLAIGAVVQNWDTYGAMSHNFYLYNNPETGQLVWIPWDHNMTFGAGGGGGQRGGGQGDMGGQNRPGGMGNVTFDKAEVGENWPLIRFLLDDPVYNARYMDFLAQAGELFDADTLNARIDQMAALLQPYIVAAGEEDQFTTAVEQLKSVVSARDTAVAEYLAQ